MDIIFAMQIGDTRCLLTAVVNKNDAGSGLFHTARVMNASAHKVRTHPRPRYHSGAAGLSLSPPAKKLM